MLPAVKHPTSDLREDIVTQISKEQLHSVSSTASDKWVYDKTSESHGPWSFNTVC